MKTYTLFAAVLLTLISTVVLMSCSKNENSFSGKAKIEVYLTDNPADYDQVVIDVKDVQINLSTDSSGGWQSLSTVKGGSYDLLRLVNDKDTLLANSDIGTGTLQQMRLVLGPNNYVVVNGQNILLRHRALNNLV
jgi:hypothetical protein